MKGLMPLFFLLVLPILSALGEEKTEKAWPRSFAGRPAKIIPLDPDQADARAWETAHFRLLSDDELSPAALQKLAHTVESVPQLLKGLPPGLWNPVRSESKPTIVLCQDEPSFLKGGGKKGTMGYYHRRRNAVLIRADLFLVKPKKGTPASFAMANEDLLVHELVHLGMPWVLAYGRPWLYEGLAEYLAAAHLSDGQYRFDKIGKSIRAHILTYLPRGDDGAVHLPHPADVLALTSRQWTKGWGKGHETLRPYAAALLLVHYQLESPDRRTAFEEHLTALQTHQGFRQAPPELRTDDPGLIAKRLQAFWNLQGLKIRFTRSQQGDQ